MRLGILGGTFNPIHLGHLRIAEEAREAAQLERILFIPTHTPPHKGNEEIIPPHVRLEMVAIAVEDNPSFDVSDMELTRGGRSYSVETLKALRKLYPGEPPWFIIGMDSFLEIGIWKNYGELFELTNFIVAGRPGSWEERGKENPIERLPVDMREHFCYDVALDRIVHRCGLETRFMETTFLDISSTGVRQKIEKGKSIRYLIPPGVENFIREKGLYRKAPSKNRH